MTLLSGIGVIARIVTDEADIAWILSAVTIPIMARLLRRFIECG